MRRAIPLLVLLAAASGCGAPTGSGAPSPAPPAAAPAGVTPYAEGASAGPPVNVGPAYWDPAVRDARVEAVLAAPEDPYASGRWKAIYRPEQQAAYRKSLGGVPVGRYDPAGFLAALGLTAAPQAPGRTDVGMYRAFRLTSFKPDPAYFPGPTWLVGRLQKALLAGSRISPHLVTGFDKLLTATVVRQMERVDRLDPHPYGREADVALGAHDPLPLAARYWGVLARRQPQWAWGSGVHQGSIKPDALKGEDFGTYDIARQLGFTAPQARRIASENDATDTNETHYTQDGLPRVTKSGTGGAHGDYHWHYNRSPEGAEDTRIAAAKTHLARAVKFARAGHADAAERELGIGLHSLQDMFSHGQITPINHALVGDFPDWVRHNPQGMYETAVVTEGYLQRYVDQLALASPARFLGPDGPVSGPFVQGDAAPSERARLEAHLGRYPAGLVAFLADAGVRLYLAGPQTEADDLGFGADLDGDGELTRGRWVDVNGDGDEQPEEVEGHLPDGRAWAEVPAAYDGRSRRIFLRTDLPDWEAPLRHEIRHALDDRLGADPEKGAAWRRFIRHRHALARRAGTVAFSAVTPAEHFADGRD